MANPSYLLDLPFELRDMIWTFSSSTGDANGLLRCCRRIRDEFAPYCILPKDIHQLHRLRIWVDSTYDHGIWLKFDYTWEENGYMHRAIDSVCDMDDPIAQKLINICRVKETMVHLHAPRRGHFVGALFMMLAKADDAYNMVQTMSRHVDPGQADMGHTTIVFSTQSPQPDQSTKEAKNFWECRSPKVLQEPIRNFLRRFGQMPYFYEYFLINSPYQFPRPPIIEYLTWPRRHAYRHERLLTETVQKCLRMCKSKRDKAFALDILMPACDIQNNIAIHSAKMMTSLRDSTGDISNFPLRDGTYDWECINYDTANLKSRYQFWLDNLAGPVGGSLDMLRLHRFKTMDASVANFFSRQARKARNAGGLAGAATEINRCLRTLFNPLAAEDTRNLRNSCSHLRAVSWATDYSSPPQKSCPRALWLKHYPRGIRYHWNGRNLVQWRLHWTTQRKYTDRFHASNIHRRSVWLYRWWECSGCCQDATGCMNELVSPFERECLQNWEIIQKARHCIETDRPLLLRREGIRPVERTVRRGCRYSGFSCRCLALECDAWSQGSTSKLTFRHACQIRTSSCCHYTFYR